MKCTFVCFLAGLLLATAVQAEGPRLVTYQGVLTDMVGAPVEGLHTLTFTLHPDSGGTSVLWEESHTDQEVSGGLFNVILGQHDPFPTDLFEEDELWLGITLDGGDQMAPRIMMTSVPWSMHATTADHADVADYAHNSGGGTDNDWSIDGDDMYSAVSGNVGIGETTPLRPLHVQRYNYDLPETGALDQEEVIIEDSDAVLGLYSSNGGSYGSAISLAELQEGALSNKWTIVRSTGASSQLLFRYGTDAVYNNNPILAKLWQEDDDSALLIESAGNSGSMLKLKGPENTRGALQFLDGSNVVDAEIKYRNSSNPLAPSSLRFIVGGVTPMGITSTGRVGIGTLSPDTRLDVRSSDGNYRGHMGGLTYGVYGEDHVSGAWGTLGDVNGGVAAADDDEGTAGWMATSTCGVEGRNVDHGNYGRLGTISHGVYGHVDNPTNFAGYFDGKVRIKGNLDIWNDTRKILELGEGLDYAEGFNLTDPATTEPGTVLAIAPESNGKLTVCRGAYDTRVAGIAAGARGLKSGVRLGVDGFDCDVALAGRVYCNVDAREHGIEAGDLLTTAALAGYAMKATDPQRSQGAILGKAMESLEKGQRGQILVLVTLQ